MKKLLAIFTCMLMFYAANSYAGGYPGAMVEKTPPMKKAPAMQQTSSDDLAKIVQDLQNKLNDTINELNKTKDTVNQQAAKIDNLKNELAAKGIDTSDVDALPANFEVPFRPLAPRQTEGEFFGFTELCFLKARGFGPNIGIYENSDGVPDGNMEKMKFDYEFNYRLGGGYKMPNDKGELSVTYWRFDVEDRQFFQSNYVSGTAMGMSPYPQIYDNRIATANAKEAYARAAIEMSTIDFEYKRPLRVFKNVDLKIGAGPRIMWTEQDLSVQYTAADNSTILVNNPFDVTLVGPRASIETRIYLPWDLSFFAKGAGALLIGEYETSINIDVNGVPSNTKIKDTMLVPNIEYTSGLTYAPCCWNGDVQFSLGYQYLLYPGLQKGFFDRSDLSFDGVVSRIEIDF